MPRGEEWPLDIKDKVVEMYVQGTPWNTITAETGVPMATALWWLHERGIKVQRRGKRRAPEGVTVDQVLAQLAASERERGRLEARVEALERELAARDEVAAS